MMGAIPKIASGSYIGVYIPPRALYTKMRQSFIYFVATSKLEVKEWIHIKYI